MRFTSFGPNRTEGITAHALPPLKQFLERFQDARVNASRKNLEPFQTAQFQMEPFHFLSCKQGLRPYDDKYLQGRKKRDSKCGQRLEAASRVSRK